MSSMLWIPDYHARPDLDNERAVALGNFIVANKPDVVVMLGDWADMWSLSSYDKGKRSFEGRRYKDDVESAIAAQEALWGPLDEYNAQQRANKKAQYRPWSVMFLGNHDEGRIDRVTNLHPELHDTISVDDLKYNEYWDVVVPFKESLVINGFAISHYFTSGNSPEPISGVHAAHNLLVKNGMSTVCGHSHLLDMKVATRADGKKQMAISAGCFTHPDMIEGWNKDTQHKWWNGVIWMDGVKDGYAEVICPTSQAYLMENYL